MSSWNTDRPPTEQDGDRDGEVLMRCSPNNSSVMYVHWSCVKNGNTWKHTCAWKPQAPKPQPQPGEVWRYRNGNSGTVRASRFSGTSFPLESDLGKPGGYYAHYPDGRSCLGDKDYDLVERLEAAPSPKPPEPAATSQPQRFVSITRIPHNNGGCTLEAVDEDGVAWRVAAWRRITPLPASHFQCRSKLRGRTIFVDSCLPSV